MISQDSLIKITTTIVLISSLTACNFGQKEGNTNKNATTFNEPADPNPAPSEAWESVPKGIQASFVTIDNHFPYSSPPAQEQKMGTWQVKAWRGERVHTQVLIWTSEELKAIHLSPGNLTSDAGDIISSDNIRATFMRYVMANLLGDRETGCRDVTLLDTVLVADVITNSTTLNFSPKTSRPVWLSIDIPSNAKPGLYYGTLNICGDDEKQQQLFNYEVHVSEHQLPPVHEWSYHLDLWQNPFSEARYHQVETWSDAHFKAMQPSMQLLANAGQKVITAVLTEDPWNSQTYDKYHSMIKWVKKRDGTWEFDYSHFDKWVSFMMDLGIDKYINCYGMIPWGMQFQYYDESIGRDTLLRAEPGTDAYLAHWTPMLQDFARHLKEKGWLNKTVFAMDERPMDEMLKAIEVIKSTSPDFQISLAGSFHVELVDKLVDYSLGSAEIIDSISLQKRRSQGLNTTFYTCCAEAKPNTFTTSPSAEAAWLSWHALNKGYDGYLRWAYNCWNEDPLQDTRHGEFLAGDTWLIYPNGQTSVRFERLREGIQDYEKVKHIRKLLEDQGKKHELEQLEQAISTFELHTLNIQPASNTLNAAKAILNRF